ncbi:MAG TPA: hypothetical protein VGI33_05740 [Paenibacillus sp.]
MLTMPRFFKTLQKVSSGRRRSSGVTRFRRKRLRKHALVTYMSNGLQGLNSDSMSNILLALLRDP